jgi:hypothetical protein
MWMKSDPCPFCVQVKNWISSPSILNYSKQKCQLLMEERVQDAPHARRDGTNLNF